MTKNNHKQAIAHLKKDKVLAKIIAKHAAPVWAKPGDLFSDIVENIIGQQLSGKAANTIIGRFKKVVSVVVPKKILAISDQQLRDCGMSWAKVKYVKELSRMVQNKELDLEKIKTLPDEEVIVELTKVKGIGRWTAEMVLIFYLQRPDVFSLGDLGLRTALASLYKISRDDLKKIAKISATWSPHRSLASRYLWISLDNE